MIPAPKPGKKLKVKKKAKTERQLLIKQLDDTFSLYIRERDGYQCQMQGKLCNCGGNMQCNHLISRANYRLRWDEKNAVCGCSGHNSYAHYHEPEWREFWMKRWPDRSEYLMMLKNNPSTYSNSTLKMMIRDFGRRLQKLNDARVQWRNPRKQVKASVEVPVPS